jgi:hypothetical protein
VKLGRRRESPRAPRSWIQRRTTLGDIVDETANLLIEAKGSVARDSIRAAIVQLMDYRRFADGDARLAILLPEQRRDDLRRLLDSVGIGVVHPVNAGFEGAGLGASEHPSARPVYVRQSG